MIEKPLTFRGHSYKIYCHDDPVRPSNWSFVDEQVVRDRWWHIDPGAIVFDVGAAYGSYSMAALACGAEHVFAWSPQCAPEEEESEAYFYRKTLAINGWSSRATIEDKMGCYDRNGWYRTNKAEFLAERPEGNDWQVIPVRPLDDVPFPDFIYEKTANIGGLLVARKYWMKLDVEGAEEHVFRGGEKLIRRLRPKITVENHNFLSPGVGGRVRSLLESWGYTHVDTVPYGHGYDHSLYVP
jgi:hypothetical protein